MGTMKFKTPDPAIAISKQYEILAHDTHLMGQIGQLVRRTGWLPITAQNFTHGRAALDLDN
jgi:hypothetical protein